MSVRIKPHHLLDIFKLFGRGIYPFHPDDNYGHDFYKIGNSFIDGSESIIMLTMGADDICKSCRYCAGDFCTDKIDIGSFTSKDSYNRWIDHKLIEIFEIDLQRKYALNTFLTYVYEKLTIDLFCGVWEYGIMEDNISRYTHTKDGIKTFLFL